MIRQVEQAGWQLARTRRDHRIFKHLSHPGTVVIPGGLNDELKAGTAASIRKIAGV
jgi:predicted RNA binding protein YcfA (HicA-like mRNA interferase family)